MPIATVTATNSRGPAQLSFEINIDPRTQATAAGTLGPYSFSEGVAISATNLALDFTANGNTLTYAMVSALPSALAVSSAGSMTGTPAAEIASASYTVRATDEYGRQTDSTFSLTVAAAPSGAATFDDAINTFDSGTLTFDEAA